MSMERTATYCAWVGGAVAALAYGLYAYFQPTYTYALLDARYDAHQYARAYEYFSGAIQQWQVSFPFHARILVPWLASLMPFGSIVTDFVWLNGFFVVSTVALLGWYWAKLQIRSELAVMGLFWLLFHWKGLIRMYLPDPVTGDVAGYFLQVLWLVAIMQRWSWGVLWMIALGGALQKESFLVVVGVTALWSWKGESMARWRYVGAFMVAVAAHWWADSTFAPIAQDWRNHPVVTVLRGFKRYAIQPDLFVRLPTSWLMAFGGFWLPVICYLLSVIRYSLAVIRYPGRSYSSFFTLHSLVWLLLSVVGGGDTTRILFNGMPFVLTFLLLGFQQQPRWASWYAIFASLPLMRWWELEPDLGRFPAFTHRWCVECWTLHDSWGYWLYAAVVLAGYYYLTGRLGGSPQEAHKIDTSG